MNATTSTAGLKPTVPARPERSGPGARGRAAGQPCGSREARLLAAAILEVLAGERSPTAAAQALGVSLPRYYQLEQRAVQGLLAACEPLPRGRSPSREQEQAALRQECARWRRECARQQALLRAAQRSVGLTPAAPATTPPAGSKKRRPRPPRARALTAAARLRHEAADAAASAVTTEQATQS
jgi:hypothetical protein